MAGLLFMTLASVAFSAMVIFVRLANEDAHWALVAAVRAWVGAIVVITVALKGQKPLWVKNQPLAWGRSLFGCCGMGLTFYVMGQKDILVADIAALRASVPVLVAVLAAIFLKEHGGKRIWVAAPLAMVGVWIVVEPSFEVSGHLVGLTLTGALMSACAFVFLRRLAPEKTPEAVALHFGLVTSTVLSSIAFFSLDKLSTEGLGYAFVAGICGGAGQLFMTWAYAKDKAARISALGHLSVVLTQALAVYVLGEQVGRYQVLGSLVVISAGLFLAYCSWRDQKLAAEAI